MIIFFSHIFISILPVFFRINISLMSKVATLATYSFFILFPFYFIKRDLLLFPEYEPIKGWKIGLIIGALFSFVLWIASMLGLLADFVLSDGSSYTNHMFVIFIGSLFGSLVTTAIGMLSGALAKKKV